MRKVTSDQLRASGTHGGDAHQQERGGPGLSADPADARGTRAQQGHESRRFAASGPKFRTDRDPLADLSSYKTFGFYDPLLGDRARYSTVMSNRLRAATKAELTRLGYTYDPRALEPDDRLPAGSPGRLSRYRDRNLTVTYKTGTLRIDLVDVARNSSVWQSSTPGSKNFRTGSSAEP